MTLYDSSVLIDYLDGDDDAVAYVQSHLDERAVCPALVLYEVYQGEVFKSGSADFGAVDDALEWITVVEENGDLARAAAELQAALVRDGTPLAARDAFIAGAASALDETLAVSDADFDVDGIGEHLDLDFV
jgi:predicted nucleic acid-binding protein